MALMRFKEKLKYIVFDTETESTSGFFSRPWQLSFLVCEGKKVLEEHDHHIDIHDLNISDGARRVTGFDQDAYDRKKRPAKEVWEKFSRYYLDDEYLLVGHNVLGFDIYQINTLLRYMRLPSHWSPATRYIDTLALARAVATGEKPPSAASPEDRTMWQYKMLNNRVKEKCTLSAVAKKYGIEIDPAKMHDALEDIRVNQKVFVKQIFDLEI